LMAGDPSPESVGEHLEEFVVVLAGAAPLPRGLARHHFSHDLHLAPPPLRSAVRGGVGTPCSALRLPVSPFPPSSLAPQPPCSLPSALPSRRSALGSRSPQSAIRNPQFEIETGARPLRPRIALTMQRPLMLERGSIRRERHPGGAGIETNARRLNVAGRILP